MDRKVKASLIFAVVFFSLSPSALAEKTHYFVLQMGLKNGAKGQASAGIFERRDQGKVTNRVVESRVTKWHLSRESCNESIIEIQKGLSQFLLETDPSGLAGATLKWKRS